MAFPTTSVIETFTAANGTLVDTLTNWGDAGFADAAAVLSNAASTVGGTGSYVGAYRNDTTYGPDCEAYLTCSEAGTYFGVIARGSSLNTASWGGYKAGWNTDAGGTFTLEEYTAGAETPLDSATGVGNPTVGHKLGIECIGTAIKVYYYNGSSWSEVLSATDSTHTGAGNIGFDMFDGTAISVDDFGGGTVAGGTNYSADPNAAAAAAAAPLPGVTTVTRPYTIITIA